MKEAFLHYIKTQRKYSLHTLKAYELDLTTLENFLKTDFDSALTDASIDMIRSWVVALLDEGYSRVTIHRKVSSVKSFYNYLVSVGTFAHNPAALVKIPGKGKKLPVFLSERQTVMLTEATEFSDDFAGCRDRLIIEMFYQTGIRRAELVALDEAQIDFYDQTIKVTGKRNKQRVIPVQIKLVRLIRDYLKLRNQVVKDNTNTYLFVTSKGNPVYPKLVYRVVNKYLQYVSTASKKSPHVLRHTFATHMLNNGADINAVKELLGHASLSATQVYTHNTIDKIKSIYKQAHPRA